MQQSSYECYVQICVYNNELDYYIYSVDFFKHIKWNSKKKKACAQI